MATPSPAPTPEEAPARRRRVPWSWVVFAAGCLVFGAGLGSEPHFMDESAYLAQSFYADLFVDGHRNDPAWLDYGAFDLPPGAKYVVGLALRVAGLPRPSPASAWGWYQNPGLRVGTPAMLLAGRVPMVVLGALGCVAIFAIGKRAFGLPAGLLSAGLLMACPVYRLHARRAMSDIPAEACGLVALAIGLAAWSRWLGGRGGGRAFLGMALGAGGFAGLAVLAKLNGSIAGMALAAWAALGLIAGRASIRARIGLVLATVAAGAVACGTFVALNPFLTAHPPPPLGPGVRELAATSFWGRARTVRDHRVAVSAKSLRDFSHNALPTLLDKLAAVAVQGYGRFSPFGPRHSDSTRRFDWRQDWGAVPWLPLVLLGVVAAARRGREQGRRGEPPTAWAVLASSAVALVAVASFIPLAWDRYFLDLQPGAVLLASAALTSRLPRPPATEPD